MVQCPSTCWYQPCARKPRWWTSACSLREQRSFTVNARLEEYWTKYSNGEVSTSTFLKAVSHLYGPSEWSE
ncbi:hypothetical protein DPMN_023175 [Dreissena polymorpha]|uniref:Uncharacterized protein n=1 Tax=Dreissena polymorpha TaxID=45954 RepID=A0A9D4RBI3_DREPO|nr:hypothetical protein DPMN_023175 [Dreissena polymorpha]